MIIMIISVFVTDNRNPVRKSEPEPNSIRQTTANSDNHKASSPPESSYLFTVDTITPPEFESTE